MNWLLLLTIFCCSQSISDKAKEKTGPEGLWLGELKLVGQKLRIVVEIKRNSSQALQGTLDSIDQSAYGIPITTLTATSDDLSWEVSGIGAKFVGKRNADKYVGEFTQGLLKIPFVMERIEKRPGGSRPQDPKKPYPYLVEEVAYENPAATSTVHLAGTLTMPKTGGPHPAVILITGSGKQNRDEELFNHRPFLVLADYLTRQGIAVLRVDDRGIGYSKGGTPNDTSEDFASDVLAGVQFLSKRKEIDTRKIGLIGHSEGGMIAPMVAAKAPDQIAFLVLMAGTGVTGEELLYLQGEKIMRAQGVADSLIKANREVQNRIFAIVRRQKDPALASVEIEKAYREMIPNMPAELKAQFANDNAIKSQVYVISNPWMRYFLTYDPRPALKKVKCPVLAINGEKDLQVVPEQNLPEIEKALKAGGNSKCKFVTLPKLNHLFQTCNTGHLAEYGIINETIAPIALSTMAEWIREQTGLKK